MTLYKQGVLYQQGPGFGFGALDRFGYCNSAEDFSTFGLEMT